MEECWTPTQKPTASGYVRVWLGSGRTKNGMEYLHRLTYEASVGEIPVGLQIDHLCRNKTCVNPDHLEPVTQHVNILRSDNLAARYAKRDRCKHGHKLSGDNLRMVGSVRRCIQCKRRWVLEHQRKHREAANERARRYRARKKLQLIEGVKL